MTESVKFIREGILRGSGVEFKSLFLRKCYDFWSKFTRKLTHLAEYHVPCILIDGSPARLALEDVHEVHESRVLDILAERRHERRITEARPYIFHFLEKHDHELVESQFSLALRAEGCVDGTMKAFEVGHHRAHHSARKTASDKKRTHVRVVRVDPVSEEVVNELLGQGANFHIGVHVQVLHLKSVRLQHFTYRDDIRMDLAPRQRLHRDVEVIRTGTRHLQHRSRRESRTAMAMVLHLDMRIFLLYPGCQLSKECRASDTCHILETDLITAISDHMVYDTHIVIHGMYRRIGYRKGDLRYHACLFRILHAQTQVPVVVETAERTGNVRTLSFLHLIHELADICRNRIHTEGIESSFEHMGLDAGLMEWGSPFTDRLVRILAKEKVHLFESASIGLDTVKAAHVNDCRSDFLQLSDSRDIFARRLPHVPVYKGKLYFSSHKLIFMILSLQI